MSMVCPQCHGSFSQRLQCPSCGVRLEYQAGRGGRRRESSGQFLLWQETPWGRLLVGLMLAQGLYYGLWHLCKAGLMAVNDPAAKDVWLTLYGLLLMQGFQVVGLLIGGALAGAGRRQGALYGGIVGLVNGIILVLVVQQGNVGLFTPITLYGQPVLQTAVGALGGFLGSLIWRPLPALNVPNPRKASPRGRSSGVFGLFKGRVAWIRVLLGVAIAVGGSLFANAILDIVLEASEGKLSVDTHLQSHLVTWEITALALLIGGGLAGGNCDNGLKNGLMAGLVAATMLVGFRLGDPHLKVHILVMDFSSAVILCMAGGWFGGQLLPPRVKQVRRKGIFEPA
jgi:hypothetical protein